MFKSLLPLITLGLSALVHASPLPDLSTDLVERAIPDKASTVLFSPPQSFTSWRTLYARNVVLPNGYLLATFERYSATPNDPSTTYFEVFRSTDNGATWKSFSKIMDTVNGWGMRYQPHLYVLPKAFAGYAAGTVLAAGNSVPGDLSKTKIDVYASKNGGQTWTFVSSVATGGAAQAYNGPTPIWEPFLLFYNNSLTCFYSDQRDPAHGQKLTHQTTTDLKTWGANVNDVADPNYDARPGMTTVAALPNGQWIMTYEYPGAPNYPGGSYPVFSKVSNSPLTFGSVTGYGMTTPNGNNPLQSGSPFVYWVPSGGSQGTVMINGMGDGGIYINKQLGGLGTHWTRVNTPEPTSYSRSLTLINGTALLIMGGGPLQRDPLHNVTYSIVQVSEITG